MFGLDRYVTMNALADVAGGPTQAPDGRDMRLVPQELPQVDVLSHLLGNPLGEIDEPQGNVDPGSMASHEDVEAETMEDFD